MIFKEYKPGDTITQQEYKDILNAVDNKFKIGKIIEGEPTFFDSGIQLSRREFKKCYPNNKIVYSLKECKNYVTNKRPYCYIYFSHINPTSFVIKDPNNLNKCINFINSEINVVNSDSIVLKDESYQKELPSEMVEKLKVMLGSKDKDTFDLGWSILFQYDHVVNQDKFIDIIGKSNSNSYYRRKRSRVIEAKLKQLKQIYPNLKF